MKKLEKAKDYSDVLYYSVGQSMKSRLGMQTQVGVTAPCKVHVSNSSATNIGQATSRNDVHVLVQVHATNLAAKMFPQAASRNDVCLRYGILSVDVVQLDCECMVCRMLRGLLTLCQQFSLSYSRTTRRHHLIFPKSCVNLQVKGKV